MATGQGGWPLNTVAAPSVMVENLMELSKEKGIKEFREIARRAVNSIGRLIEQSPLEFLGIAITL